MNKLKNGQRVSFLWGNIWIGQQLITGYILDYKKGWFSEKYRIKYKVNDLYSSSTTTRVGWFNSKRIIEVTPSPEDK